MGKNRMQIQKTAFQTFLFVKTDGLNWILAQTGSLILLFISNIKKFDVWNSNLKLECYIWHVSGYFLWGLDPVELFKVL